MLNNIENYNKNVFTEEYLQKHLSKKDFQKFKNIVNNKVVLDKDIASKIADVMKKWAIEKGASHYSHWFQPLSGSTAEKQTSFLSVDINNNPIIEFSASALITGEIDASSFPNGGLRSIFEARGLTGWDYTYPAFIKENSTGKVLCIPTVLKSLDGTSLDKRTPLLNSCEALNKQVLRILRLFGDNETTESYSAIGIEQEYFLIKKEHYKKRKDLMLTGKTLFGKELIRNNENTLYGNN
ncbi:MAG: glutamine synthetase III [Clostridia bacterium]|nr:glutamine synthetase III [Clostridia bacterium]